MGRETNRLIQLVNQLLVLARSDAGALSLNLEQVDLEDLVRERSALMNPLASQKGIELQISKSETGPFLATSDRARTAQVFDNLLDNALRYAPEGSIIQLRLDNLGSSTQCAIVDAGPGIPAEDLIHIFERFYRVEKARDRDSGGAGLGLAIARSLIEAQGGEIFAQSEEGDGTRMVFRLPGAILSEN
jgi:signal transduction histidine kinase